LTPSGLIAKMALVRAEGEAMVETIGQRLRRLRHECGLSQRDLASPGVSYAYISRIEAGARRPSVKALRQLAPKLGVSVEYLETGKDLSDRDQRELRLAEAELKLRLEQDSETAEAELSGLLADAEGAGDAETAARARAGLGELADRRGDFATAIDHLERARAAAVLSPLTNGDLFATLARAYAASGQPRRAVEVLEDCLSKVQQQTPEDVNAEVRFATYLSYALSDLGELDRARAVVREALSRAQEAPDPYARVRLYWSLARLAIMEGKPRSALRQIQRAIGLLEATEDTRQLARAHLGAGEVLTDDDQPEEAQGHFELAEKLLGDHADAADLAWLYSEQARASLQTADDEKAERLARQALSLLEGGDPLKRARAYATLAEARPDEIDASQEEFAQALAVLEEERRWPAAASVLRAWSRALRRSGREQAALDVLDRAAAYGVRGSGQPAGDRL
jgi:transcriptional regulator with XRE-family HTH domain